MRLLPKSIHRSRRYPTKFNSGRDIPKASRVGLARRARRCMAPLTVTALVVVLIVSILFWDSWRGEESGGTAIRNLVLVLAAIIGLPLAIWRSKVAEHQAETAQRGLLNERYQKGAEMLGSDLSAVRIGGIYALARLAGEHPGDYHLQIMSLLCAFLHHHPAVEKENQNPAQNPEAEFREDCREIIQVIVARSAASRN